MELLFLQSKGISEAQTQLLTLANDVCKDQFTVIADITFLLRWQRMDVKDQFTVITDITLSELHVFLKSGFCL